jgi:WD40 repeat protein
VIFWETATGKALRIFNLPDKQALTYSLLLPNDQVFLTAGADNIVHAWDARTLAQLQTFKGHENAIYSVAVTSDSKALLTVSKDHSMRVWDFATGAQLRQISYPEDPNNEIAAEIDTVILSADNTHAFTSAKDGLIRQWNWQTGQLVKNFQGHTARVLKLALSPDGKLLASTSADLTAIVWDIETAQVLHRLGGFNSRVTYPAFSPNGKFVLVSSWDNLARLFYTDIRDLLAAACDSTTHDFTDNERAVYGIGGEPTCPQFVVSPTPIVPLPTTTALPNLTLPAWTPIGLPTASPTPTLEPTLTAPSGLFVTFTPTR